MLLRCEAILFDIDGTLVDSTASVERIWRAWAPEYGLDADTILRTSHGRRSQDVVPDYLPAAQVPAALRRLDEIEVGDTDGVVALPAVAEVLAGLPAARWAAVTSGERHVMVPRLQRAGLPVPAVLVTADDVSAGKPDPEGYLAAAHALGVDPARCLVVEDAPAGIAAGQVAGAQVRAVGTSHPCAELTAAEAVVADLTGCRFTVGQAGIEVEITS